MKVLVTGADGFVGGYIVAALIEAGHDVIGAVRRPNRFGRRWPSAQAIRCDLSRDVKPEEWAGRLTGVDAVINAAGVLQAPAEIAKRVHADAPIALFTAAGTAGVRRIIQLSAMGADIDGDTGYQRTKAMADRFLETSDLPWSVLRPSMVVAPGAYGGTALFRAMAVMPGFVPLVGDGGQRFQPIHIDDLCRTVLHILDAPDPPLRRILEPVSEPPVTMKAMLAGYRAWFGLPPPKIFETPKGLCRMAARLGDRVGGPVTTTSYRLMEASITAEAAPFKAATGIEIATFDEALSRQPAQVADLWQAQLYLVRPLLIAALCLLWIATGIVTAVAGVSGTIAAITAPLGPTLATLSTYGGAGIDLVIGSGLILARWRRLATMAGMIVTAGYLFALTIIAPGLWLDPFGILTKAVVVFAAMAVLLVIARDRT